MGNPVVLPTEPRSHGKCGCNFPFILEVGHVEGSAQAVAAPRSDEANTGKLRVDKCLIRARAVREVESVVRSLPLVEPDAANLMPILKACRPWVHVKLSTIP